MSSLMSIDLALATRFSAGDRAAAAGMALASWAVRQGHAGLPLDALDDEIFRSALGEWRGVPPDAEAIREAIGKHPNVGDPSAGRPFVIELGFLYLRRLWTIEHEVAQRLLTLAQRRFDPTAGEVIDPLDQLLPDQPENATTRAALKHAARCGLTLLTGGPGTGKTWTAARLLSYLQRVSRVSLRMAAAAPTGKAAARLTASLREHSSLLQSMSPQGTDVEAQTLHRLLGVYPYRAEPRHGLRRPLPVDVLLLDEASMVDLPILLLVLRALPNTARLVLLGDADQLPALGGGRVLADLLAVQHQDSGSAAAGESASPIRQIAFGLTRPHRFSADSSTATLLSAVRRGDATAAVGCFATAEPERGPHQISAEWSDIDPLSQRWRQMWRAGFAGLRAADIDSRLAALLKFRVLCAGAEGPRGVAGLNAAAEIALFGQRVVSAHYDGQPVLVRENAPRMDLWNGDLGVVAPDALGDLRAWFTDAGNTPRAVRLDSLPAHQTSYAMSVHKAQGSEFESMVLMLPALDSPLLTREWLYTGLSRGRTSLTVVGDRAAFSAAVIHHERRWSRLPERLLA